MIHGWQDLFDQDLQACLLTQMLTNDLKTWSVTEYVL